SRPEGWGLQDTPGPDRDRRAGGSSNRLDRRPDASSGPPLALVAGAASRDIGDDDPRGWRLGGAVNYASLTLARLGVRTRALIGVDPAAGSATELDLLRDAGVEICRARLGQGPVFENIESA